MTTLSKYGDQTDGAMTGKLDVGGKAELTFSRIEKCTGCGREIPGSCNSVPSAGCAAVTGVLIAETSRRR